MADQAEDPNLGADRLCLGAFYRRSGSGPVSHRFQRVMASASGWTSSINAFRFAIDTYLLVI